MSTLVSHLAGQTLIGYFDSAHEARQCLLQLHLAGFSETNVGIAMPRRRRSLSGSADAMASARVLEGNETGPAIVTVRSGVRGAEARRIVRRGGGGEAAARPGSPLRPTVNRATRIG
ncbi:MAG: hypothetical protein M3Z13_02410 [Candidatus Dormibacteraeota bacterium]|nr:hypothetical protein [Candidatus Dormibacteraeota bacterium]